MVSQDRMRREITLGDARKQLSELLRQKSAWERTIFLLLQEEMDFQKETEENFAQLRLRNLPKGD